jgi:hypothetical protein
MALYRVDVEVEKLVRKYQRVDKAITELTDAKDRRKSRNATF